MLGIFLIAGGALWYFKYDREYQQTKIDRAIIESELKKISLPSDGAQISFEATHRLFNPLAQILSSGGKLSSYDEIKEYFDEELSKKGWRYVGEEKIKDWGRDFGGMERHYCKGNLFLNLQFPGKESGYGWIYALSASTSKPSKCQNK